MIVVRVSLISARSASRDRDLGVVLIANDGTGDRKTASYNVQAGRPGGKTRRARVENFPRRSRSALELLRRALCALDEKGELP